MHPGSQHRGKTMESKVYCVVEWDIDWAVGARLTISEAILVHCFVLYYLYIIIISSSWYMLTL